MKLFKLSDYYQAMAEDPRPTAWSKGSPGVVGSPGPCWVGNLTWHYEDSLKSFQFHWYRWVVSLPGTSIGIRCDHVDVHYSDPPWFLRDNNSQGAPFS